MPQIGMEVQLHTAGPMHRHCMAAIPNTHFHELGLVRPDNPANALQPPIHADGYGDWYWSQLSGVARSRLPECLQRTVLAEILHFVLQPKVLRWTEKSRRCSNAHPMDCVERWISG